MNIFIFNVESQKSYYNFNIQYIYNFTKLEYFNNQTSLNN